MKIAVPLKESKLEFPTDQILWVKTVKRVHKRLIGQSMKIKKISNLSTVTFGQSIKYFSFISFTKTKKIEFFITSHKNECPRLSCSLQSRLPVLIISNSYESKIEAKDKSHACHYGTKETRKKSVRAPQAHKRSPKR